MDMGLGGLRELVMDRRPGVLQFMGSQSQTRLSDWTELKCVERHIYSNINQKIAGIEMLVLNKINFREKSNIKKNESQVITKRTTSQENVTLNFT